VSNLKEIDVLILCGGLGKRLRSSIGESQKAMAKINGRPFLDILLSEFHKQGFRRIILCSGYKSDDIERYYKQNHFGLTIDIVKESEPLGTGGAIKNAQKYIKSNPFIALNGDSICPLSYKDFIGFHLKQKAVASIVLTTVKDPSDFGLITLKPDSRIKSFQEKAKGIGSKLISAGIYCFKKEIFGFMPGADKFSVEKDFFPVLVGQRFFGYKTEVDFLDIGTPERYNKAKQYFESGG
jgi:D-glycero-alpha-D-manno-heptose 1-phosphate guanylyltransferase